jgi:serine/threonine protein kinase
MENCTEFSRAQFSNINCSFAIGAYERAREGDEIADYRILRALAAGHISTIYEADNAFGTRVRLREFAIPDECDRQRLLERLIEGGDWLRRIDHANICRMIDSFVHDGKFYYALEMKGGATLPELFDRAAVKSLAHRSSIALKMAELIQALHESDSGNIHGHVYPGVFRLDDNGSIYLADYGFAHNLITQSSGVFNGDISYAAPEQLGGEASQSADIYGLAASIFYLHAQKAPPPLCPSSLSAHGVNKDPRLDVLIEQCTAYSASDRPKAIADVVELLQMIESSPTEKKLAFSGRGKSQ